MGPTSCTYKIFGKSIEVAFDESRASEVLRRELDLYPSGDNNAPPDLVIRCGTVLQPSDARTNPGKHTDFDGGFISRFRSATVGWEFENRRLTNIGFALQTHPTGYRRAAQRWLSMQYTNAEEAVGQIFHELVLVPSVYFDETKFLVHASALQAPSGETILVGGTGGVGKTSLELELCLNHGFRFMADDVAVVSDDAVVWPNLSYPKIYGYNLENNPHLTKAVLEGQRMGDRLNWRIHSLRGLNRVRRRLSPLDLYGDAVAHSQPFSKYIILARENREDVRVDRIDSDMAAVLTVAVMDSEYEIFHQHLAWHEYNRGLARARSVATRSDVMERWKNVASNVFARGECYVLRVPEAMKHEAFKAEVGGMIARGDI